MANVSEWNRHMWGTGIVYILRGELRNNHPNLPRIAWKIGATGRTPQERIKCAKGEAWWWTENIEVIHTIQVDNMRVVEMMFHERYKARRAKETTNEHCEWFAIADKVEGLKKCVSVSVEPALQLLAQNTDTETWFYGLTGKEKRGIALSLWKHPKLRVTLDMAVNV